MNLGPWIKAKFDAYWKIALALLVIVPITFMLGECDGRKVGRAQMQHAIDEANRKALEAQHRADEAAANQRLTDQRAADTLERNLADAVANIPDSVPNARRLARACAQLRAQRIDTSHLPQCVGPPGTAQAPASR